MADLQKPAPAKRALPFKRTVRPRPPSDAASRADDDDGLALFSQSKNYFTTVIEDQQRRARETAEKAEQEREAKLAREREEEEKKAREAQSRREKRRKEVEQEEEESESAKKRRPNSLLFEDDKQESNDNENDDVFADTSSNSYRLSTPYSPETRCGASAPKSSQGPESTRAARTSRGAETPIVLLDSSDDEDPTMRGSKVSLPVASVQSGEGHLGATHMDSRKAKAEADDSDSELEIWEEKKEKEGTEGEEEDPSEYYIKAAMERMRRAKEARLARESSAVGDGDKNKSATPGTDDDDRGTPVSVMIAAPALPDAKPLCCTVRTTQALQIAFDTFKERQKRSTTYPHKLISELIFTWRGDRVYHTTKLETLGIRPRGPDGRLYDNTYSGRNGPEGYVGKDKVYFEAWSPEDYEENQKKQERERKRREMGEWWDEDDTTNDGDNSNNGQAAEAEEDDRVKVIFKARDMPPRNVTLRKYSTVAHMIKAFRKLANINEDKHVEIRWDGEVLDLETTVEEADIADMDSVEVHVR